MNEYRQSCLAANLDVLKRIRPDLANYLQKMAPDPEFQIIAAQNGDPVLIKKGISLHSRHNPREEGRALAESPETASALDEKLVPLVVGLGLGYHILPLAEKFAQVIIFEPDPQVLLAALTLLDWSDLLDRLTFILPGDALPDKEWRQTFYLPHRPTLRLEPAACGRFQSEVEERKRGRTITKTPHSRQRIMLVTPVRGGSLPVARHTAKALKNLGHTVIEADLSPLDVFYRQVWRPEVPSEKSQAVAARMMAFIADYLTCLAETEKPDLLLALAQAPLDRRTLGRIRSMGIPTAFWFVEDYRFLGYFREVADCYDFFFHIQDEPMEKELTRLGHRNFHYLPLAAAPAEFRPISEAKQLAPYKADLSFMGAGYPNRKSVFSELLGYDLKIWGTEWDLDSPLGRRVQQEGRRVSTEETALIFNAAAININLHSSVFTTALDPDGAFVNPRTFEVASCGAFQLLDRRRLLSRHFEIDREMIVFDDVDELKTKIDFYLARPELRSEIASRARLRVLAEHTYEHRMAALMNLARVSLP